MQGEETREKVRSKIVSAIAFIGLVVVVANVVTLIAGVFAGGESRTFIIINDSDTAITYTVLHDDGDNANTKSLSEPQTIGPFGESEFKRHWSGTYCLALLEGGKPVRSFALKDGVTPPQSMRTIRRLISGNVSVPVYYLSQFKEPCEFDLNVPFDQIDRK